MGNPSRIGLARLQQNIPFELHEALLESARLRERIHERVEGRPHISVAQGKMLVDNFSSIHHTVEVARNDLDLTGTRSHHTAERGNGVAVTYLAERAALEGANTSQIRF